MSEGLRQLWAGWRKEYVAAVTAPAKEAEAGSRSSHEALPTAECVFCRIVASGPPSVDNGIVWRGERSVAVLNAYPYASGHLLVMPVRHVGPLHDLSPAESAELWETTRSAVDAIIAGYRPDGVNLGANLGKAAGAGIPEHVHLHVLPRWLGDTNFMTTVAGVRVIPETLEGAWKTLTAAWPSSH